MCVNVGWLCLSWGEIDSEIGARSAALPPHTGDGSPQRGSCIALKRKGQACKVVGKSATKMTKKQSVYLMTCAPEKKVETGRPLATLTGD